MPERDEIQARLPWQHNIPRVAFSVWTPRREQRGRLSEFGFKTNGRQFISV